MIHINKFIDKVSVNESKQRKDVVLNIEDARGLRDEISKLLGVLYEQRNQNINQSEEPASIEIKAGTFK